MAKIQVCKRCIEREKKRDPKWKCPYSMIDCPRIEAYKNNKE